MWYTRNGEVSKARAFARNQRYKLYESREFFDIAQDRLKKKPVRPQAITREQQAIRVALQAHIDRFADIKPASTKR